MTLVKSKQLILVSFLFFAALLSAIISVNSADAQTTTTFPTDEAGIGAYVRPNLVTSLDITAASNALDTITKQGSSYVIGMVLVTNEPHFYIGGDGWLVAYFLNTEEASRIAGGTGETTLKDAIDRVCGKLNFTCSDIKYYDFEFPEANQITVVTKNFTDSSNVFYVTVTGTLYEASYRVKGKIVSALQNDIVTIKVDDVSKFEHEIWHPYAVNNPINIYYGSFNIESYFSANTMHNVSGSCKYCYGANNSDDNTKMATVFIYKK